MRLLLPPSRTTRDGAAASLFQEPPRHAPLAHYTGTLFKALAVDELTPAQLDWAATHLIVHSSDRGLVHVGRWEPAPQLADLIADGVVVVDLRSGEFVRKTKLPAGGWSVRVVSEGDDGRRLAVSHWNKLHKGVLIGALIRSMPTLDSVDDLLTWTDQAGFRFEPVGDRQLEFVV